MGYRPTKKDPSLLSTGEVADMFQVSTQTARGWVKEGKLPHVMVNGFYRVPREAAVQLARETFDLEITEDVFYDPPPIED